MATATQRYRVMGVEHAAVLMPGTGGPPIPVVEHDMHFIREVNFDVQQQDITFEGDQQAVRKYFLNGINITTAQDTLDLKLVSEAFNKQVVTTGLPTGVTGRLYMGDTVETAGVKVGFLARTRAENLTTQLMETLHLVMPVCSLTVVRPTNMVYNGKVGLGLIFAAEKTSNDIAGVALPSVPTGGAFWYVDWIT